MGEQFFGVFNETGFITNVVRRIELAKVTMTDTLGVAYYVSSFIFSLVLF